MYTKFFRVHKIHHIRLIDIFNMVINQCNTHLKGRANSRAVGGTTYNTERGPIVKYSDMYVF
jgi:hypothetical protein